jgi:hypothetical protein
MEKEFKTHIQQSISNRLIVDGLFKLDKKIKLGAQRPGSCVWRWRVADNFSCFVALEFYSSGNDCNLGIGWSKRSDGVLDFVEAHRTAVEKLDANDGNLDALAGLQEVYLYRTEFGSPLGFFGPAEEMASIERAKDVYADPDTLKRANASAAYTETDWEKNTMIRYWGIMKCFMDTPLTQEDAEYATGDMCREMLSFLENLGLPYLMKTAQACCPA